MNERHSIIVGIPGFGCYGTLRGGFVGVDSVALVAFIPGPTGVARGRHGHAVVVSRPSALVVGMEWGYSALPVVPVGSRSASRKYRALCDIVVQALLCSANTRVADELVEKSAEVVQYALGKMGTHFLQTNMDFDQKFPFFRIPIFSQTQNFAKEAK